MLEHRFSLDGWQHLVKEVDQNDPVIVRSWCGIAHPTSEVETHDSTEPWLIGCAKCLFLAKLNPPK